MPEKLPPDNPDRELDRAVRPDAAPKKKKPSDDPPTLPREKGMKPLRKEDIAPEEGS